MHNNNYLLKDNFRPKPPLTNSDVNKLRQKFFLFFYLLLLLRTVKFNLGKHLFSFFYLNVKFLIEKSLNLICLLFSGNFTYISPSKRINTEKITSVKWKLYCCYSVVWSYLLHLFKNLNSIEIKFNNRKKLDCHCRF